MSILGCDFLKELNKFNLDDGNLFQLKLGEFHNLVKYFRIMPETSLDKEFFIFKKVMRSMTLVEACSVAIVKQCSIPKLELLFNRCMTIQLDSLMVERYFSMMKLFKSIWQASMTPKKLENLLMLGVNYRDLSVQEYSVSPEFFRAFEHWLSKKTRNLSGASSLSGNLMKEHETRLKTFFEDLKRRFKFD